MRFVKFDMVTAILFLIISIVVPPLFVVNLILLLIQIIIKIKKYKDEKKLEDYHQKYEQELFLSRMKSVEFMYADREKLISMLDKILTCFSSDEILNNLYVSCCENNLSKQHLHGYIAYLSSLNYCGPRDLSNVMPAINESITILKKYMVI